MYLKDYQLAEDVTQDTFIQVYEKYETFENRSSEKTWIMRIAFCKEADRSGFISNTGLRWYSCVSCWGEQVYMPDISFIIESM